MRLMFADFCFFFFYFDHFEMNFSFLMRINRGNSNPNEPGKSTNDEKKEQLIIIQVKNRATSKNI